MPIAELACPTCGGDLRYIPEYDRHYCYDCGSYAPEGFGGGKGLTCPKCNGVLSYIRDYDRYFCHKDQEYMPEEFGRDASPAPGPVEPPAPPDVAEPAPEAGPPVPPDFPVQDFDEVLPPAAPAPHLEPEPAPAAEVAREERPTETGAPPPGPAATAEAAPEPTPLPPLVRSDLWKLRKAELVDLCRAYGLSSSGGREALRNRLLSKLDELEAEARRTTGAAPPTAAETPASPESGAPEPVPGRGPTAEPAVSSAGAPPEETVVEPREAAEPPVLPGPAAEPAQAPETMERTEVERPIEPSPTPQEPIIEEREREGLAPPAGQPVPEARPPEPTPVGSAATVAAVQVESPPAVVPRAVEEAVGPPRVPEAPVVVNPCPTCGRELSYVPQYDRYYCMHCKAYAAPVVRVEPVPPKAVACPSCGGELTFIAEFNRHYCYRCRRYASPTAVATAKPSVRIEIPKVVTNPCPTCGRELRYIEQYRRWYCDAEAKYAPRRAKRPCPTCAGELTWIPRYHRYYCYSCNRYGPATLPPPVATKLMATTEGAELERAVSSHRHSNASNSIGVVAMGFVMYVLYAVFALFPAELGVPQDLTLTPGVAFFLQFLGVLFIALGTIWGLWSLNARK